MTEPTDPPPLDSNVVNVDFGGGGGTQTSVKHTLSPRACKHVHFELDEQTRVVRCKDCSAELNPFQLLLEYAKRERYWRYYDTEVRKCVTRINDLKSEEQRIKARTRGASRKDAELAVESERQKLANDRDITRRAALEIAELAQRIARHTSIKP
jgi:hypothetical protein